MNPQNNTDQIEGVRTEEPKMTAWKKEPSLKTLKEDLQSTAEAHSSWISRIKKWNALRDIKRKKPKGAQEEGRSQVQPKLVRRQAEWRYSALSEPLLSSPRLFKAKPATASDGHSARQNQILLNWQFRTKIDRVALIDDLIHSTVDDGTAVIRLGWERKVEKATESVPIYSYIALDSAVTPPEDFQQLEEAAAAKQESPREFLKLPEELQAAVTYFEETGQAVRVEISGYAEQEVEKVVVNEPTIEVMEPENFFFDPACKGNLGKARFVIAAFEPNRAELEKDTRYSNLDKVNWEKSGLAEVSGVVALDDSRITDKFRRRVWAYEYWGYHDIHGTGTAVPIVATWIGDVLIRMEENPFPDQEAPFVLTKYMPVKRKLTGEADAELLEDNQDILGAMTRGFIDLMGRSANSQTGIAKGFLDSTNKRRFAAGADYEFNPSAGTPANAVFQHSYPELSSSALALMSQQNQDAEGLSGVKSFSGGLSGEAFGDVARGVDGVLDAAGKREMGILRRIAGALEKVGAKVAAMNSIFMSESETVAVTDEQFVEVRREDLKGRFNLEIDVNTAEIDQVQAQDLAFMAQTIGPNIDQRITLRILAQIADLKRMPVLADELRNWEPEKDPVAEALKELEVAEIQAKIAQIKADTALKLAKAREAESAADAKDLEYVEQSEGITHERDMEKVGAQMEEVQDGKILDALLTPRKPGETSPDIGAAIGFTQLKGIQQQ